MYIFDDSRKHTRTYVYEYIHPSKYLATRLEFVKLRRTTCAHRMYTTHLEYLDDSSKMCAVLT